MNLTENQYAAKELINDGATTAQIAECLDISVSYVYDLISSLRDNGYPIRQNNEGYYYIDGYEPDLEGPSNVETRRSTSERDAVKTRKARAYLAKLEHEAHRRLDGMPPARADGGLVARSGGTNVIVHCTDDHFGELTKNQDGEVIINSEITQERAYSRLDQTVAEIERREDSGEDIDNIDLLLNGDHVTNEVIFEGQAHEIDENIEEQLNRASDVYTEYIRTLSDMAPTVQVACTVGNHGEFRGRGSSSAANADGILYMTLDKIVRASSLDNVTFVQSNRAYYVDFPIREWRAHMRHGHDASLEHIGTSAGKQKWLQWLVDHQFDIAFRGHYHQLKEEPIAGRPVLMGGTIQEQTSFEESHALSGRPVCAIHGATDEAPLKWTERIYVG